MISSLRGIVIKNEIPWITLETGGVGYAVQCTTGLYEKLTEGAEAHVHVYTFVREDRLELFGFGSLSERKLFIHMLEIPGVGPRTALQLCSVPMNILVHAVEHQDARALSSVKGIGKKTAEKLLVEFASLHEKGILVATSGSSAVLSAIDEDALEALANLGYDRRSILQKLREIPSDVQTTEGRVRHVLQTL